MDTLKFIIVIFALAIGLYQDIKHRKIKNSLTGFTLLIGLILSVLGGLDTLIDSFLGIIIPFSILIIFYFLKMLGAGDVKLFCALGSVMGKTWAINCMIASILSGGILALGIMIFNRNFLNRMKHLLTYLKNLILLQKIIPYEEYDPTEKATFPFAIAITIGGIISFWIHII